MMTEDNKLYDLVTALKQSDNVHATNIFKDLMGDKINDALDDKRIELAQGMMGNSVEYEQEEDTDEDIQSVSDDESEWSL